MGRYHFEDVGAWLLLFEAMPLNFPPILNQARDRYRSRGVGLIGMRYFYPFYTL
jgi:hypothetical protein